MSAVPAHLLPNPEPTGYIQPGALRELWFHTGTACNLACPFCLEGSRPGDGRLQRIALADVRPLMDEAAALGVQQFSLPAVNRSSSRTLSISCTMRRHLSHAWC